MSNRTSHTVPATIYLDHLETTQDQLKKLWALFSQIQQNLKNKNTTSTTAHLVEIGNFLSDMWAYENEEEYETLKQALEGIGDE